MNTAPRIGQWIELSDFPNRMKVEAVVNGILVVRDHCRGTLCLAHPGGTAKRISQWGGGTVAVAYRRGRWFGSSEDALKKAIRTAEMR
jgi:hypothetical protein